MSADRHAQIEAAGPSRVRPGPPGGDSVRTINDLLGWVAYLVDRIICRTVGAHGPGCRGRQDHTTSTGGIVAGRWR